MTGIADIYLFLRNPVQQGIRKRISALLFAKRHNINRFVVLSWKRTGSNLLCGILFHHPEILMHNELFNTIDIFTYYPQALRITNRNKSGDSPSVPWNVLSRDIQPENFLNHIWTTNVSEESRSSREETKAVGFKSFPEHWRDSNNELVFMKEIMHDSSVKKIILHRENELSVFVSMLRAEITGNYMSVPYPRKLKVHVCPEKLQAFVNNYRDTFQRRYRSILPKTDTFHLTYEQLCNSDDFEHHILPLLWKFMGVRDNVQLKKLKETIKQTREDEGLESIISNFEHVEFCFRHTDVSIPTPSPPILNEDGIDLVQDRKEINESVTWSILLPICSRIVSKPAVGNIHPSKTTEVNRFGRLSLHAQYTESNMDSDFEAWGRLEKFAESMKNTIPTENLSKCEFIVGVDLDDPIFSTEDASSRIKKILPSVVLVQVQPVMYGKMCRIWNLLAQTAKHDYIVLLGDDVHMIDYGWQNRVENKFKSIASTTALPFGAACVALNDVSFPGFPTFPVIHRWHMKKFGRVLPRQFVNQGGDPYLFEIYSRWNASAFELNARLENCIGGNECARYLKHSINWKSQVLSTNMKHMQEHLNDRIPKGICLDVVVPSFRCNNLDILRRIVRLRASIEVYTRFWIIVDNPDEKNLKTVRNMALEENHARTDGNFFVSVVSYGENRGASYARNVGYNYSSADWLLFLDDDVVPEDTLLDAYIGGIYRYPEAKVLVGQTELPPPCNLWTRMISASNVSYFYGISNRRTHPSWGVTANLMVRGSRFNHTIQFKMIYPKSGGGEDIDFVFQMKDRYGGTSQKEKDRVVVAIPGAKVTHPWWKNGEFCYRHIIGWAWGDSQCMLEWPERTFMVFPNWVEAIALLFTFALLFNFEKRSVLLTVVAIVAVDHLCKAIQFFPNSQGGGFLDRAVVSVGAGTVISSQEISRCFASIRRLSPFSFCRRMDWFDGQSKQSVLDYQLRSFMLFVVYCTMTFIYCT